MTRCLRCKRPVFWLRLHRCKCTDETCFDPERHGRVHVSPNGRMFCPMNILIDSFFKNRVKANPQGEI